MLNTEKLISLKENFTGQQFQWIKTNNPNLLAKIVKCRDIIPLEDGRFIAHFDDGSKIDTSLLNSSLLMIHGDNKPLTKDEVLALNKPKAPLVSNPGTATQAKSPAQSTLPPTPSPSPVSPPAAPKVNMFAMFNSEETSLNLTLSLNLPDKKLLKLMYTNAENKDKFMSDLSEYVHGMINKQVIQEAMSHLVAAPTKVSNRNEVVKMREI